MMLHGLVTCVSMAMAGGMAWGAEGLPRPLVELTFGAGLRNTGSLGGEATVEEYAPDEGPVAAPGVRGMGMAQLRPSRAGGPGETPAGGAVVYEDPALSSLAAVTLALWFQADGANPIARLLYHSNQWDLYLTGGGLGFTVRHGGKDQRYVVPGEVCRVREGEWTFAAVVHDRVAGRAALHVASVGRPLRRVAEWTGMPLPDPGAGRMQIGNLERIRPFRGRFDSIRVYDRGLTEGELGLLAAEGNEGLPLERSTAGTPAAAELIRRGDIVFSSRGRRPDSLAAIEAFRPDRLLWHYAADGGFVESCRGAGVLTVQGAINSIAGASEAEAQALDLDGKPVIAPWMLAFDRVKPWYWGCNNRPRFLALSVERAAKALALGVDWLQFDDWAMIVSAHSWGGACFCDDCMALFRADLAVVPPERRQELGLEPLERFDYREYLRVRCGIADAATYRAKRGELATTALFEAFQRRSVRRFFADLRREVDARAGRHVPLSINSTLYRPAQRENFLVDLVDFLEGETWQMDLVNLVVPARAAEALGTLQVFSPIPRDLRGTRRAIATAYALGQQILVPWDIYMGSDATGIKPRYYGTVEEYGDLFGFVRRSRRLLDGHDTCATVAVVTDLDHPDPVRTEATCRRLLDEGVPFVMAPVGTAYYRAALDRERLGAMRLLVLACDREALPAADREVLAAVAEGVPVCTDVDIVRGGVPREVGRFRVWAPAGVVVLARAPRAAAPGRVVLHVLNHSAGDEVRWVSVVVAPGTFGGAAVSARWHAPGQEEAMETEVLEEGLRLFVPRLREWGIVELELAGPPG